MEDSTDLVTLAIRTAVLFGIIGIFIFVLTRKKDKVDDEKK